jgi:hypothetical protein
MNNRCPVFQDKVEVDNGRSTKQKMILGTHTSEGEQNYLMIAEVQLPTQDSETDASNYDEETGEVGGYGAMSGKVQVNTTPFKQVSLKACRSSGGVGGRPLRHAGRGPGCIHLLFETLELL